jgi:alpha-L-fucosidase
MPNAILRIVLIAALVSLVPRCVQAQAPLESPAQKAARLHWWSDARFGMFIHCGLYTVPAGTWKDHTDLGEWFMDSTMMPVAQYEQFARRFNPTQYDPDEWARIAKDAGMKYIVITAKHHEGFAMWDTQATDYNIAKRTSYGKGVLKPLADAARRAGLHFGTYYSIMDWHHPSQYGAQQNHRNPTLMNPQAKAQYIAEMKAELKELIEQTNTEVLWFDGEWVNWWTVDDGRDMVRYLHSLKPNIVINNRVAYLRNDMEGMDRGAPVGDFGTPEQQIPPSGYGPGVYWESCMTLNDHWGYNRADQNWKSPRDIVRNLIDIASKGGNYLLNVGPTAEGLIPPASVERLAEVGKWMHSNGAAIYATGASPFADALPWGRVTQKPGHLYLHVFDWPADGKLVVPMRNAVQHAHLLATPGIALKTTRSKDGVTVVVPAQAPDAIASVVVLDLAKAVAPLEKTHAQAAVSPQE